MENLGDSVRFCPHCKRDMQYRVGGKPYSKAYLVEIQGVYDGGLFYADIEGCGMAWHRWEGGTAFGKRLRELAQPYIDERNQKMRHNRALNARH